MLHNHSQYHEDRDQFIRFFFNIAVGLKNDSEKTLFVGLGGQFDSGKGLVALAFDLAYHPEKYPNNIIGKDLKVDDVLSARNAGLVHFVNAQGSDFADADSMDDYLMSVQAQAPQSRVHFLSNLQQSFSNNSNGQIQLNSKKLDGVITIMKQDNPMSRQSGLDANRLKDLIHGFKRVSFVVSRSSSLLSKYIL